MIERRNAANPHSAPVHFVQPDSAFSIEELEKSLIKVGVEIPLENPVIRMRIVLLVPHPVTPLGVVVAKVLPGLRNATRKARG